MSFLFPEWGGGLGQSDVSVFLLGDGPLNRCVQKSWDTWDPRSPPPNVEREAANDFAVCIFDIGGEAGGGRWGLSLIHI